MPFDIISHNTSSAPVDATPPGYVEYAAWLSDDLLVMVGWFPAAADASLTAALALDGLIVPLDIQWVAYPRRDILGADPTNGKVLVVRLRSPRPTGGQLGVLLIHSGSTVLELAPSDLAQSITDLPTLIHEGLMPLDTATRIAALDLLSSVLPAHERNGNGLQLSRRLFAIREALRTQQPACVIAPDQAQSLYIDTIAAVGDTGFYIQGWLRDRDSAIARLTAVAPEGFRVQLLDRLVLYPRPDIRAFYGDASGDGLSAGQGFVCYFDTGRPSYLPSGWVFELHLRGGAVLEAAAPTVVNDPIAARTLILSGLPLSILPHESLMLNHIFPAISQTQQHQPTQAEIASIVQYGPPPLTPDVSIVVPLYRRIDFVEQQLAQFVHDPELRQTDLIYVLDSPELADQLRDIAPFLYELYHTPFRIVVLKRNAGFSAASNAGARVGHGRLLLLLNSDVIPDQPGWLGRMVTFYDTTPRVGALGPKLLYEDDTLQHAGMYFHLPRATPLANLWQNMHYYKGLHRSLPAANVVRRVPGITGACLMVAMERFHQVGGLQALYVQGDHEDSDLCLRLIAAGYENWYLPDAELYHLEGQSYPDQMRGRNALYNRWLHTHLWGEQIVAVMERYTLAAPSPGTMQAQPDADPLKQDTWHIPQGKQRHPRRRSPRQRNTAFAGHR
jgi:GT2 family glycosyltransferase